MIHDPGILLSGILWHNDGHEGNDGWMGMSSLLPARSLRIVWPFFCSDRAEGGI